MNASSTNSNTWFVCPRPNPQAETRLFFFPYAGGGPAVFGKWCLNLPARLEGWTIHYPGRGSRHNEPPIKRLSVMVEEIAEAIQPLLDKPFAFFGHSMGGLVAFGLARHLRRHQLRQPNLLIVSACAAPHLRVSHPPIHELPDPEFLNALEELNGIPREILQNPEALKILLPALRADFEIIGTYQYSADEPLDCPIVAFGGYDDPRIGREQLESWAAHTKRWFKSHYFPGAHFFMNTARDALLELMAMETKSHA